MKQSVAVPKVASTATTDDEFAYYTQRAGEVCRQFNLAGVGAILVLQKAQSLTQRLQFNNQLSNDLKFCLIFIVASLVVDAAQYLIGSLLWYLVWRQGTNDLHKYRGKVTCLFLFGETKLALGFVGYFFLVRYAWDAFKHL